MNIETLKAISPIDGRYANKVDDLRDIFSEYGLIYYRVLVEVHWLQFLSKQDEIIEIPQLSETSNDALESLINDFSIESAEKIKTIEKTTNHDVKAVEYFIKESIKDESQLNAISEFVHFACTSEDINNLAYALMLKDGRNKMSPHYQNIIDTLKKLAHEFAEIPMLT